MKKSRFLFVGVLFILSQTSYSYSPDEWSGSSTGVPEFNNFFGGGLYFKVSDQIRITADLSIRQAQNDNIDKYLASGNFDYYSLLSFGVTYSIGRIFAPSRDESNVKLNKNSPVWRTDMK